MIIGTCIVTFRAEWVSSLKEKRMVVKSLLEKTRHKFHISIAEVDKQDLHQLFVLGFACVTNERRHAESILQTVLDFMENHTEAELLSVEMDIF